MPLIFYLELLFMASSGGQRSIKIVLADVAFRSV